MNEIFHMNRMMRRKHAIIFTQKNILFIFFIFLLQLIFNIISYQFQMQSIVVLHLNNLKSNPLISLLTQLALYRITTILLTLFYILYFTTLYFVNSNLYFLIHLKVPCPLTLLPSDNHHFVLCICQYVSVLYVHLFCFLYFTYK